jgi:NAD-dependent dihydropyrimidine dehydrogenase PreA subunit
MTYVVSGPCIDVMDKSCIEVCPVDCIYEGARKLYINPEECIDCGACEPECPVEAISYADDLPEDQVAHAADNKRFFAEPLSGRDQPLGLPGGFSLTGRIGVDTPLVESTPATQLH